MIHTPLHSAWWQQTFQLWTVVFFRYCPVRFWVLVSAFDVLYSKSSRFDGCLILEIIVSGEDRWERHVVPWEYSLDNMFMNDGTTRSSTEWLSTKQNWTHMCTLPIWIKSIALAMTWTGLFEANLRDILWMRQMWLCHFIEGRTCGKDAVQLLCQRRWRSVLVCMKWFWRSCEACNSSFWTMKLRQCRQIPALLHF